MLKVKMSIGRLAAGHFLIRITAEDAHSMRGMARAKQAKLMTEAAGMMWDKVPADAWSMQKSRNFIYHPNTYILYITTKSVDDLYATDEMQQSRAIALAVSED